jgi:rod shape-determining protein MreB
VSQIIDAIKSTLDKTPPELSADIMDRIVLAAARSSGLGPAPPPGGRTPTHLASPLTCVAVGSGRSLGVRGDAEQRPRARSPRRNGRGR